MQDSIEIIYAYCKKWRLTVNCNRGKAEVVITYPPRSATMQHQWKTPSNEMIHRTSQYKYLGVVMYEDGRVKPYIQNRTQSSINTMGMLHDAELLHPEVSLECRLLSYTSLVLPIMTYGCQTLFYGTDLTFAEINEFYEKRHRNCIRQLLHTPCSKTCVDWMMAEAGQRPIIYYTAMHAFSFYARMFSADSMIPAYQVYDRMWQMDTHPHASGAHPNKMYHSSYVQQITLLADRFGVNTDNVTVNWISNMKRSVTQH